MKDALRKLLTEIEQEKFFQGPFLPVLMLEIHLKKRVISTYSSSCLCVENETSSILRGT